jgi:hypothetical protein
MPKKAPAPPSAELLARIESELTQDIYAKVYVYAENRSGGLMALEGRKDPQYAMSMVLDAVADTLDGIRAWNPERRALRHHLMRVVNSRISHDLGRARRRRHVAYHEPDDDGENDAELEMSLRRDDARTRPEGALALRDVRERLYGALRVLAETDRDVLVLLGAYEDGYHSQGEVMARLAWSLAEFRKHRRRLNTIIRHLPDELRTAALDAVTRAPTPATMEAS